MFHVLEFIVLLFAVLLLIVSLFTVLKFTVLAYCFIVHCFIVQMFHSINVHCIKVHCINAHCYVSSVINKNNKRKATSERDFSSHMVSLFFSLHSSICKLQYLLHEFQLNLIKSDFQEIHSILNVYYSKKSRSIY